MLRRCQTPGDLCVYSHMLFMAISLRKLWVRGVSNSVSHHRDARSDRNQGWVVGGLRRFTNEDGACQGMVYTTLVRVSSGPERSQLMSTVLLPNGCFG